MLHQAQKQYFALKGTAWENAAKRNMGFFAVAGKLLYPETVVPALVKNEVAGELALIEKHEGIAVSSLMNIGGSYSPESALKEDYSQYIPRGHYERTDLLKMYFKSMMWYGRMTFRIKNEDEVKSAVLITLALNKEENRSGWDKIYEPTNFLVGKSDDLNYYQFSELLTKIYGQKVSLPEVISRQDKWTTFLAAVKKLTPPAINSIPVFNGAGKDKPGIAFLQQDKMEADIKTARTKADLVVVFLHAGQEYAEKPDRWQVRFARCAVRAGADLVLGHHPHVIQRAEKYRGKYIFYSLGNFVFDQTRVQATREGLMVKIFLNKKGVEKIEFLPVFINDNFQPQVIAFPQAKEILKKLKLRLKETPALIWDEENKVFSKSKYIE